MSLNQSDLDQRLREHQMWVDSAGEVGTQLWLPEADLAGVDLSGRDLTEAHLAGAVLDDARLTGTLLSGAILAGCSLRRATLESANLSKANLDRIRAEEARMAGANLLRCSFIAADLRRSMLDRTSMVRTLWARADLRSCSMRGAQFDRTSFNEARFEQLDATGARGTFLAEKVTLSSSSGPYVGSADQLLAFLREAGASDISIFGVDAPGVLQPSPTPATPAIESFGPPAPPVLPPGWHADPTGRHDYRWWDGAAWTSHVSDGGIIDTDSV